MVTRRVDFVVFLELRLFFLPFDLPVDLLLTAVVLAFERFFAPYVSTASKQAVATIIAINIYRNLWNFIIQILSDCKIMQN